MAITFSLFCNCCWTVKRRVKSLCFARVSQNQPACGFSGFPSGLCPALLRRATAGLPGSGWKAFAEWHTCPAYLVGFSRSTDFGTGRGQPRRSRGRQAAKPLGLWEAGKPRVRSAGAPRNFLLRRARSLREVFSFLESKPKCWIRISNLAQGSDQGSKHTPLDDRSVTYHYCVVASSLIAH